MVGGLLLLLLLFRFLFFLCLYNYISSLYLFFNTHTLTQMNAFYKDKQEKLKTYNFFVSSAFRKNINRFSIPNIKMYTIRDNSKQEGADGSNNSHHSSSVASATGGTGVVDEKYQKSNGDFSEESKNELKRCPQNL